MLLRTLSRVVAGLLLAGVLVAGAPGGGLCATLAEVRQRGVLRHLGIPYANFVTEEGAGLDVDLMQSFAQHLGVRYEWVKTSWSDAFGDLTGHQIRVKGEEVSVVGQVPVRGDVLANGLTVLPWRQKVVAYSVPTFPTGVWLVARADSPIKPIEPSGDEGRDVQRVLASLTGRSVLTMKGTCLDADLYDLHRTGAEIRLHTASQRLDDIAPAVLAEAADTTLLDIPDALVALQRWPGDIKVIGPVSPPQRMGVAFSKKSPELVEAFNRFFAKIWNDGSYERLVRKHYPSIFLYEAKFFRGKRAKP